MRLAIGTCAVLVVVASLGFLSDTVRAASPYCVNQLDRTTYEPTIHRGWQALYSAVSEDGKVRWGQNVAPSPYYVLEEDTAEYVWGIFLLAGSQMIALLDG